MDGLMWRQVMATDYYLYCGKCKKSTYSFSRQAWGWGNANIIDSFRFIMKHIAECDQEDLAGWRENPLSIRIIVDDDHELLNSTTDTDKDEDLKKYFPFSADWDPKISRDMVDKFARKK